MSSLNLFDASIPVFIRGLRVIASELEIASKSATERGFPPDTLASARLYPDMIPLSAQVQRASDTSKFSAERLGGVKSPSFPDTEQTLAELIARAQNTIAFLQTVTREQYASVAGQEVKISLGNFTQEAYLLDFALPNFYFHVTTVHAILRHNGVKLGKRDYLGLVATE